jgi:GTP cyclohydrolase II
MFAYIDPRIAQLLQQGGRIHSIDRGGERRISMLGPVPLPVRDPDSGEERSMRWYPFVRRTELDAVDRISAELREGRSRDLVALVNSFMCVSSVLLYGNVEAEALPLVRLHSCCMTGDVFGSLRCECGPQLRLAYRRIFDHGAGAVVYMASHEGRGIGLWAKAVTYLLQDMGQDTYQANESLGLPADSRDFTDAALALGALLGKDARVRLLTNNPMKAEHLERGGLPVAERVPLVAGLGPHNLRYMHSKRLRGHDFGASELPAQAGRQATDAAPGEAGPGKPKPEG